MAIVSGSCARVNGSRNGPSVSAAPPGPVGQSQPMIAVWEWQDDQGYWRPYSGQVSAHIERCASRRGPRLGVGGAGSTSVCLGQSDPSLSPYLIDIPSLKQFRQDTGTTRSVRRSLFAQSSGLSSGVYWEWANDEGGWTPYETRTSILLEHSYQARQGTADLGPHGYNYIVDLTSLAQVNKATGFRRQVRRQCNLPYPLASSGPPAIPSTPACSCQQCLSHSSTGPMPSRSRHSFSSGSLNRPSLQGTGRVAAAHPTSVYSPYPRRPLSVGGMSWGSPWPPPASASHMSAPHLSSSTSSNGLSVPSISVQLNGSTSVSSALAGMASILMSAVGLGVHFTTAPLPPPQQPQQPPPPPPPAPFALPPPPPLLPSASRPTKPHSSSSVRRAKRQHRRVSPRSEEVIQRYMEVVAEAPNEDCIICMDQLSSPSSYETPSSSSEEEAGLGILPDAVGKFIKCGHTLHMLCMLAMYNNGTKDGSLQCPSCKTIYGEKTGTQPKGKMEIYSIGQSLPGHPDCGSIQIIYSIPPGIQSLEHPNPGQPYTCRGFPRFCFLPDNDKGRKVLELLKVAWMRRLIFTVGTSSTTGEPDTVVWNGIHHKTEMMSNLSGHGYPDPNYLDNVLSELASQGVTEDCLKAAGAGGS
ncbi:putative E3 ubiquitin-protein ligase DTX2 [Austrofundulus limnaeus]|uniref:E3 ubiquitin-protein ligase n=1 Tax=Austrofundulus limnaeus TaxID=52670 RepID=A0A2I4AVI7_AUSLI|nr:PREDICTED: probable E3 ubiquitin-protein ligase DTX2 [Austrofundulus limnaeus]